MMPSQIPSMTAAELTDETVLVDVREPHEWALGRAVGAVPIPMSEITGRFADLPDGDDIAIVCHSGQRSARVTMWLVQQGYQCRNLAGGMVAYANAGLPMAADGDATPVVD